MKLKFPIGLILILMLLGCSNPTQNEPESPLNPEQQTLDNNNYAEDDAIALFKKNKDYSTYEISDYVSVKDDKLPMLKAVISFYDNIENNSCNLAFIYGDTIKRINFAVNELDGVKAYEIDDNRQLTYIGDGAVTTSIRKIETNEIINYTITFSYDESTSTTNFKIESEKSTK